MSNNESATSIGTATKRIWFCLVDHNLARIGINGSLEVSPGMYVDQFIDAACAKWRQRERTLHEPTLHFAPDGFPKDTNQFAGIPVILLDPEQRFTKDGNAVSNSPSEWVGFPDNNKKTFFVLQERLSPEGTSSLLHFVISCSH